MNKAVQVAGQAIKTVATHPLTKECAKAAGAAVLMVLAGKLSNSGN